MAKPYILNEVGNTLHILHGCKDSTSITSRHRCFESEKEVLAYAGLCYKWCEKCAEKRENLVKDFVTREEEASK